MCRSPPAWKFARFASMIESYSCWCIYILTWSLMDPTYFVDDVVDTDRCGFVCFFSSHREARFFFCRVRRRAFGRADAVFWRDKDSGTGCRLFAIGWWGWGCPRECARWLGETKHRLHVLHMHIVVYVVARRACSDYSLEVVAPSPSPDGGCWVDVRMYVCMCVSRTNAGISMISSNLPRPPRVCQIMGA